MGTFFRSPPSIIFDCQCYHYEIVHYSTRDSKGNEHYHTRHDKVVTYTESYSMPFYSARDVSGLFYLNCDEAFVKKQIEQILPDILPGTEKVVLYKDKEAVRIAELLKKHGKLLDLKMYKDGYHGFGTDQAEEKPEQDKLREDCFRYKVEMAKQLYAMCGEENHGKTENV